MSSTAQQASDVAASVSKLTITPANNDTRRKPNIKKAGTKKKKVADSWEDEDVSSASESTSEPESGGPDSSGPVDSAGGNLTTGTKAPPPTPVTPNYSPSATTFSATTGDLSDGPRRPEKTDAVARRMIASALGVKVPKQTEEQKAYDKAMREKERKRREEERELEKKRLEEAEKAKKAIWED
ncbi:hypothetical protein MCOR27_005846 [Pyricularia oryzae]|uniref:Ubiquitin smt3 n=5 Tax=Pyricularia TaxID=48558 RepID=A0ABQ8N5J7_PYRGI|nr:uncharacterized protein MGG_01786 [Pyricularia oryzae 70-15]ELQ37688.1 hypothetical protein OOU_Y34scaffold00584g21 [Pyricularia oryzae Y34]KAH8839212.1 hypothetical protein MCOR01_008427 [Pyricularia oryzae]KAI6290303.1 hypothetical protein MCOR33_011392 [Pyricularia grisea]EHA54984.1 hypothetical protein MGG_01786 [Pyricularia oryzae 70-15]KAH9439057.1 hypothetical protein MCOR02_002633 [Pyricularia oryzae]